MAETPATINVHAEKARDLISKSWFSANDPVLKLWTNSTRANQQRGKVHKDGGDRAGWKESFTRTVRDSKTEFLYLEVLNNKNDQLIGRLNIV